MAQSMNYWPELRDHLRQVRQHSRVEPRHVECCICYGELKVAGLNGFQGYRTAQECAHEDIPLVLPCGHIIGRTCLFRLCRQSCTPALWGLYQPTDRGCRDKCPLCDQAFYINATSGWVDGIHAPLFRDEDETVLPLCLPRPRDSAPNRERPRGDVLDETSLTQCWGVDSGKPFDRSRFSQTTAERRMWWRRLTRLTWLTRYVWFWGLLSAWMDVADEVQQTGLSDEQKTKILAPLLHLVQLAILWLLFFNAVAVLLVTIFLVRLVW